MLLTVEISTSEQLASESNNGDKEHTVPELALLQAWASAAYLEKRPVIACLRVTTLAEIQQLNKQYRDIDKTTNVLSFPMQSPEEAGISLLGDIVLCAMVINSEAQQQAVVAHAHWAHMVVHGMLHLQGFDHVENEQAEEMERLEISILNQLGFENPYSPCVDKDA